MQPFPTFVYDDAKWLRRITRPLDRLLEIERELQELPIRKEELRRDMEEKGFFFLASLKKQLRSIRTMPAGNFNSLARRLENFEFDTILDLMIETRSPKPKPSRGPSYSDFMSMSLEDELPEEDAEFRLRSLVEAKMGSMHELANPYFAINGKLFDKLRAEKAELEERLRSPHPVPKEPEQLSRR